MVKDDNRVTHSVDTSLLQLLDHLPEHQGMEGGRWRETTLVWLLKVSSG